MRIYRGEIVKYGHFDDEAKEYVILTPETPLPWINYLGCRDFFTLVSNTSGGYSFYKDARLRRLTRYRYNASPLDSDGLHFYIDDGGDFWNPGWQPVQKSLDSYSCRHGLGYTVISGERNGISAEQTMFVPVSDNCLLVKLVIRNGCSKDKVLKVYSYTEFCLWDANDDANNFQRNYSCGEVEVSEFAIYHKTEYRERRNHYAQMFANVPFDSYDTARDAFIGVYGSPARPKAVRDGSCSCSVAHGWAPVGAMEHIVALAPGEEFCLVLGLGYIENENDAKWESPGVINKEKALEMQRRYSDAASFDAALKELKDYWNSLLSVFSLDSENDRMNRMVNIWNQYQCMVTFNMSRSASYFESGMGRGMGFRDSCQDLLGFVHIIPERARERILDIAATQFPDGSAYHQYQPLTKKGNLAVGSGFNDDPLWLIAGTDAYIKETGDYSILSEMTAFDCDESNAAPLMEHLRRSFNYTRTHLGPHGLPQIGRADWNDCLNLNCFSENPGESFQTTGPSEGPVAESVFIAGMFVLYGKAYADICSHLGLEEECADVLASVEEMKKTVLEHGWDGKWFLRAYDAFGDPVGSSSCDEGRIFIEPQGMCVMAGIGAETGEAAAALESVREMLDTRYGTVLLQPAYTKYRLNLGEISSYPPGYKENASVFCHNNAWIVCAEAALGHGNRAFEVYSRIAPAFIENLSEVHRTEPYVYSQMIAGKDAPTFGEAKNSWLTGTAAWTLYSITQSILGIRPVLDGLEICPCIPSDMSGYTVRRKFRGAEYIIKVENPGHVESGIEKLIIDGRESSSNVIPPAPDGSTVNVTVIMGR